MKTLRTLLVACTLGLALAACGGSPAPLSPDGARFDGGHGLGSGHTSTTSSDSTLVTADGGHGFGSDS